MTSHREAPSSASGRSLELRKQEFAQQDAAKPNAADAPIAPRLVPPRAPPRAGDGLPRRGVLPCTVLNLHTADRCTLNVPAWHGLAEDADARTGRVR